MIRVILNSPKYWGYVCLESVFGGVYAHNSPNYDQDVYTVPEPLTFDEVLDIPSFGVYDYLELYDVDEVHIPADADPEDVQEVLTALRVLKLAHIVDHGTLQGGVA